MADDTDEKPKRGRGRQKGDHNKATIQAKQATINIRALARESTPAAIKLLKEVMGGIVAKRRYVDGPKISEKTGKPIKVQVRENDEVPLKERVEAAIKLLEYGHGKPTQALNVTQEPPDLSKLSTKEIEAYYVLQCKLAGIEPDLPGYPANRVIEAKGTRIEKSGELKH